MATKVKGETIKEGSIPLSALSKEIGVDKVLILDDDYEIIESVDSDGMKFKIKEELLSQILENKYTEIRQGQLRLKIQHSYDYLWLIGETISSITEDTKVDQVEALEVSLQENSYGTCTLYPYMKLNPFMVDMFAPQGKGYLRYSWIKSICEEVELPEENKNIFKKNIGPFANWDAQEGEVGYIENKPFYFKNTVDIRFSYNNENDTILASEGLSDNTYAFFRICTNIGYVEDNGDEPIYVYHKVESGNSYSFIDEHNDIEYNIYVSDIESTLDITTEWIYKGNICKYVGLILPHNVKQIDNICLPDTVVKTTSQTLTDIDKNQALSNLGIDPVVWKYMCVPHVIFLSDGYSGTAEIPEDLAEVISKNLSYARLTVSLNINGEVYFASGIGNSEYLTFNIPDYGLIFIAFNGKDVHTA